MKSPMVDRLVHGKLVDLILRTVSSIGIPMGRLMPEGLRNSVVKDTDSNTSSKKHGKVGHSSVFRRFILLSEFEVTILVGNENQEEEADRLGDNNNPCVLK
jgi:hypothetical protein